MVGFFEEEVLFDAEVFDDVVLTLGGVFAHVEGEEFLDVFVLGHEDGLKAHFGADEVFKFVGADFAEAFEAGDFGVFAELGHGFLFFLVGVTVDGLFFVADAEEGGGEDVEVAATDDLGEELEEESDHQQADVHAVNVGVGGEDDVVVAEFFEVFFDVEGVLEEVELFVFVADFAREAEAVEGFAAQAEDGLGVDVAALGDAAGGAVAFGDEQGREFALFVFGVEVDAAVAEFFVVNFGAAGAFAGEFLDAADVFAFFFVGLNFFEPGFGDVGVFVEVVVELLAEGVDDVGAQVAALGFHHVGTEFGFGLRFEDGFLDFDADAADEAVADVGGIELFVKEGAGGGNHGFAEGGEVGAALGGVLAVDEGVDFVAVAAGVGESAFDVLTLEVDDGVEGIFGEFGGDEVGEAVFAAEFFAVEDEGEAGVEPGVVAKHLAHEVESVAVVLSERFFVGMENDTGAAGFHGLNGSFHVAFDESAGELDGAHFAFAEGGDAEEVAEGVDGFDADAIESDGAFEGFAVVFGTGVDLGGAFDEFAQGDTAAVVAHGDHVVFDFDLDFLAVAHDVFVDAVVENFLEQDVDAVFGGGAIAEFANIHAGAETDVLTPVEGFDGVFVVDGFGHDQERLKDKG